MRDVRVSYEDGFLCKSRAASHFSVSVSHRGSSPQLKKTHLYYLTFLPVQYFISLVLVKDFLATGEQTRQAKKGKHGQPQKYTGNSSLT